jgi:hypothetical protein
LSIKTLDENELSLPEKLNDPVDHSKPRDVEVVAEQDTSVEVDKSNDEKKEIDEHDDSEKDDVDEGGDEIEKKKLHYLHDYLMFCICFYLAKD